MRIHRRWRRLRRWGPVVLLVLAVVGGLVALAFRPATSARDRLFTARAELLDGRDALLAGDAARAGAGFRRAESQFILAGTDARNPVLRLFSWIPLLGRTPDAVAALADAGRLTAHAGTEVATALGSLPGGPEALAPHAGAFDLAPMPELADAAESAAATTDSALAILEATSSSMLLGPVADARAETLRQLTSVRDLLASGADLVRALPALLGGEGSRRYFFGATSPSEMRGSGGFMGAFSILTVDHGRLSFEPFRPITDLPSFDVGDVKPPSRDFARNYDRFGGAAFWQNINVTPDFPSAAIAIERLYRKGTGEALDGVVLADPYVLKALLSSTGPVDVPRLGRTLTADDVVAFTTNEAYSLFTDQTLRKIAIGEASQAVFERFMAGQGSPYQGALGLADAVGDGHMTVYANDERVQSALQGVGAAGAFAPEPGADFLSLVQNNAAANKVDYYLDRSVSYAIQLGAEGTGIADVQVDLANHAPLNGASTYVLGPYRHISDRGEHVSYTTLYCSARCELLGATRDGHAEPQQVGSELGTTSLQDFIELASRASTSIQYRLGVPGAWHGDAGQGTYRLRFLNQATIRPTRLSVDVQVPDGMAITGSNVPLQISGGHAHWSGTPGRDFELEISFAKPFVSRMWSDLVEFLSSPAFGD